MNAAREKVVPGVWKTGNTGNLGLLCSHNVHYSIERAAGIMGIGQDSIYYIAADKNGALTTDNISKTYDKLIEDGKIPIALIANACCTAVGRFDPLEKIGEFCNEKDLWMHVDGAHGASVFLSKKYKFLMNGILHADSVTWDAHKLMRTPALCIALLFKNHVHIDHAFNQDASYIFHDKEQPGVDFTNRTVECTSIGQALKLFMVVGAMGEKN